MWTLWVSHDVGSMAKPNISDQVTRERWEQAQNWERDFWVETQRKRSKYGKNLIWKVLSKLGMVSRYRGDDWNEWWKEQFDGYRFLPERIHNVLEVGCGPYTNVRLMLDRCRFDHLVLSDPLIRTYVKFKLTFVSEMYQQAACVLDDHPLEELPFASDNFDLVVMINVLDHVQDAHQCMENLIRVTRPGGYLIIGQDLTNEEDLKAHHGSEGEVGHPITLDKEWFDPYLKEGFEPVLDKFLTREQVRGGGKFHYGMLLFAGRKR
jgi:SAM-dependent methyltransferase